MAGFEPAFSCFRGTRPLQAGPHSETVPGVGVEPTKPLALQASALPAELPRCLPSAECGTRSAEWRTKRHFFNSAFLPMAQVGVEPTASHILSVSGLPVAYQAYSNAELGSQSAELKTVLLPFRVRQVSSGGWNRTNVRRVRAGHFAAKLLRNRASSGRRTRTFTNSFKDCRPTVSRSPNLSIVNRKNRCASLLWTTDN